MNTHKNLETGKNPVYLLFQIHVLQFGLHYVMVQMQVELTVPWMSHLFVSCLPDKEQGLN